MKVTKIFIGNHRPSTEEVEGMMNKRGVYAPYFWCRCLSFDVEAVIGDYIDHYNAGHYDTPVYKYVWEEDGIIKESLVNPEGQKKVR